MKVKNSQGRGFAHMALVVWILGRFSGHGMFGLWTLDVSGEVFACNRNVWGLDF